MGVLNEQVKGRVFDTQNIEVFIFIFKQINEIKTMLSLYM